MSELTEPEIAAAHRHFATHCFNAAWELMGRIGRTPDEDRLMVALNQASIYHWQSLPECDAQRLSVGYWQASRIESLLGHPNEAYRHGETCLVHSAVLPPFYLGYAHEALARAALLAGDATLASAHAARARACAKRVEDAEEQALLWKDLQGL